MGVINFFMVQMPILQHLLNASKGKYHELLAWECACPVECGET